MASYTFIPSSLVSDATINNPSMAYADTSNTNCASVMLSANNNTAYLGGFSISIPISEEVSTVTVKVKASLFSGATNCYATLMSASDGVALSDAVTLTETATVYTFTLTASAQTVFSYADTLCIMFETTVSAGYSPVYIYGAEVIVETEAAKGRNKIIFGNTVLIDLTSDTATEADVAVGKIFHLASGLIATGTLHGVEVESGTWSPTSDTTRGTISFSNTHDEPPAAFLVYDAGSTNTSSASNILQLCVDFTALFDSDYGGGFYTNLSKGINVNQFYSSTSAYGYYNTSSFKYGGKDTRDSQSAYYRYFASETEIRPNYNPSNYWRARRTYNWVAIWV